jgi:hypothetical protein
LIRGAAVARDEPFGRKAHAPVGGGREKQGAREGLLAGDEDDGEHAVAALDEEIGRDGHRSSRQREGETLRRARTEEENGTDL